MTCVGFPEVFLFLLFLRHICTEKLADDFRAEGENYVLGYCFGVDYVVVYKSTPEGDQLLGNSSDTDLLKTLPADLQGRVHFNEEPHLLGLKIDKLTKLDAGMYRRECWNNQSLVSKHSKQLSVCKEELHQEEITPNEEGGTELICNSESINLAGISVRWYHETFLAEKPVLFLDTGVSPKPLVEVNGVEVRKNGAVLVLNKTALKNYSEFFCLVMEGEHCLGFKNMYQAGSDEIKYIYASEGDRVVLQCNANSNPQRWQTPVGEINSSSTGHNQMHILTEDTDYSLIISDVADEHIGMYSCISPSLEIQYSLLLCPKTKSLEKAATTSEDVSLECNFPQYNSHKVLWYRKLSEQYEALSDSDDHSVPIPEDLRGRLTLSHYEYVLNISDLDVNDAAVYGCILLTSPEFIDGDYDDDANNTDYDDQDMNEYSPSDDGDFVLSERCIFKQETVLTINHKDPSSSTKYVVGSVLGGLLLLLLLLVAAVVVIIKKRRKASSGPDSNIRMNDFGCTDRLTGNNQVL